MALLFGGSVMATIKPWVFQHFLSKGATEMVLYIDGDFMIFDSLESLVGNGDDGGRLGSRHVLLACHRGTVCNRTRRRCSDQGCTSAGMFGVGPQHGGFLEFLMERLKRACVSDAKRMRFNEQRWLDFVPSLFPHRVLSRIRELTLRTGTCTSDRSRSRVAAGSPVSVPLRALPLLTSFEPRVEGLAGRYGVGEFSSSGVRLGRDPLFAELCADYRRIGSIRKD